MPMKDLAIEWRYIEMVATLEGKSLIEIDCLRDKFFKENDNEKTIEKSPQEDA